MSHEVNGGSVCETGTLLLAEQRLFRAFAGTAQVPSTLTLGAE